MSTPAAAGARSRCPRTPLSPVLQALSLPVSLALWQATCGSGHVNTRSMRPVLATANGHGLAPITVSGARAHAQKIGRTWERTELVL